MGTAMLKAFLASPATQRYMSPVTASDVDPVALQKVGDLSGVTSTPHNSEVAQAHDVVLVATEPEDVPHVLAEISPVLLSKVRPQVYADYTSFIIPMYDVF